MLLFIYNMGVYWHFRFEVKTADNRDIPCPHISPLIFMSWNLCVQMLKLNYLIFSLPIYKILSENTT